jgi:hypothetical protein
MSWDAFLVRIKGNKLGAIGEVEELPLGPRKDVLAAITAEFPTAARQTPSQLLYSDGDLSIELNLVGRNPVDMVMLEVRGAGDPITPLLRLAVTNGWAILDGSTSEYIDPKKPSRNGYGGYRRMVKGAGGAAKEAKGRKTK